MKTLSAMRTNDADDEYRFLDDVVRYRWLLLVFAVTAAIWCWVDVMPRGFIDWRRIREHRTDFTVYTEAGAAFFDGRDPYQVSNPRGWRYLYPPLFAIVVAPLHHLTSTAQVAVWYFLSLVMAFGCYYEMRRLLGLVLPAAARQDPATSRLLLWFGLAAFLAALLPVLNCLQRGQVEVLKLYLLLLGLRLALSGRRTRDWLLAGIVLAVPGVLKLTPLLPVACLVLFDATRLRFERWARREWRKTASLTAGVGAGLLLFSLFVPAMFLGWDANIRHLKTWFAGVVTKAIDVRTSDFGEDVRTVRNQSLDNAAYRFGNWIDYELAGAPDDSQIDFSQDKVKLPMDDRRAGELIVFGRIAALAALLAFVIRAAASGLPIARAAVFGMACVATLVVCPVSRGCYYAMFLPAIFFNATWLAQFGRVRTARFVAFLPALLVWTYYIGLPNSGRIGLLGLGTTAWFFCTCVLLGRCLHAEHVAAARSLNSPSRSITGQPITGQPATGQPATGELTGRIAA